jgi:hypothetical protein
MVAAINEIRVLSTALQEQVEKIMSMVADQIRDQAHPDGNMSWLQHCAKEVEALQRDLKLVEAVEEHAVDVMQNTLGFGSDQVTASATGLRVTTIEVTQGMLNQHLLTLTEARRRGKVRIGEQLTITLPDGTEFTTELCEPGNKLRERGHIRRFYDDQKIGDGDQVTLEEVSAGKWRLRRSADADRTAELTALLKSDLCSTIETAAGEKNQ